MSKSIKLHQFIDLMPKIRFISVINQNKKRPSKEHIGPVRWRWWYR